MFHHHEKKIKSLHARPFSELTEMVSPSHSLLDTKRQLLLQQIMTHSALDANHFDEVCLTLVHHLINHCQNLPETANNYYAQPGGFLDHALNRTEAALSLFRQYMKPNEEGHFSNDQSLWLYALFSAGILQGIGKLQLDYQVDVFDAQGHFVKSWSPVLESLASVGRYYAFEFQAEGEDDLRRRLNVLLARFLMPTSGFAWIASNARVLAIWLALLHEDMRSAGMLGAILIRADAVAIQRYFHDLWARTLGGRGSRTSRSPVFVDSRVDEVVDKERLLGIEFIQWVTQALKSGQIILNKAPLLSVPGGLLMSVEIFKWFVREHPEFKNAQAAQRAFLAQGLHRKGVDGSAISRFEKNQSRAMQNGILIEKYARILPEKMRVYHESSGDTSTISAVELIHQIDMGSQADLSDMLGVSEQPFSPGKNHSG